MRRISRWATAVAVCLHLLSTAVAAAEVGRIGDGDRLAESDAKLNWSYLNLRRSGRP